MAFNQSILMNFALGSLKGFNEHKHGTLLSMLAKGSGLKLFSKGVMFYREFDCPFLLQSGQLLKAWKPR